MSFVGGGGGKSYSIICFRVFFRIMLTVFKIAYVNCFGEILLFDLLLIQCAVIIIGKNWSTVICFAGNLITVGKLLRERRLSLSFRLTF